MNLKYMILGAGGTGGILGSALTKAGKDVTFIARGSNLDAMRNNGLIIRHLWDQTEEHLEVHALSMEESYALSLAPVPYIFKMGIIIVRGPAVCRIKGRTESREYSYTHIKITSGARERA